VLYIDKNLEYRDKKVPKQYQVINRNVIKHPLDINYKELLGVQIKEYYGLYKKYRIFENQDYYSQNIIDRSLFLQLQ